VRALAAAAQVGEAVGEGVEALKVKAIRVEMKIGGATAPFANGRRGRFRRFCRSNDVRVAGLDLGPVGCPLWCLARDESIAGRRPKRRTLDPFDCRKPGRCAVVVVSRLNPVRFDGGDIPSIAGVERRSQLFLTDGGRASIGTIVTEAQHIQGSIVLGHRR